MSRVRMSTPVLVTRTVCSNCADLLWSGLTAVQPSPSTATPLPPSDTPGSMVKVMPGSIVPGYEFLCTVEGRARDEPSPKIEVLLAVSQFHKYLPCLGPCSA